jgi:hypothetical protein
MVLIALQGPKTVAFLKRAGVLRKPTRRLFLHIFTLSAVLLGAFFYLFRCLAATDGAADLEPHYYYISPQNLLDIARVLKLAKNLLQGDHHQWWFRLAYLLSSVTLGCLTYIATAFAAVASHSGEHHTLSSFLRKVKSNLLRPALTLAAVCAVRAAAVEAMEVWLPTMTENWYVLSGVMIVVLPFFAVIQAVGAVAVVASVAEPGLCGKGAGLPALAWQVHAGLSLHGGVSDARQTVLVAVHSRRHGWLAGQRYRQVFAPHCRGDDRSGPCHGLLLRVQKKRRARGQGRT